MQFLIKTFLVIFIFFIVRSGTSLFLTKTLFYKKYLSITQEFYLYHGADFNLIVQAILFVVIAFIIYNKDKLKNLRTYTISKKQAIIFFLIAILFLVLHYYLKYYIKSNMDYALQHNLLFAIIKLSINILFIVFIALAVYNVAFIKDFIKEYKKSLFVFSLIGILYFIAISLFQKLWFFFSTIVTKALYFLLSLSHKNITISLANKDGPLLGVKDFIVSIGKPCSGVDSMLLFASLYAMIFVIDRDRINKKRMLLLFLPGLIGIFLFNILRVYLLMLIGIHYDAQFAVGLFHQNVGWVLFIVYFAVFYLVFKNYLYAKKEASL